MYSEIKPYVGAVVHFWRPDCETGPLAAIVTRVHDVPEDQGDVVDVAVLWPGSSVVDAETFVQVIPRKQETGRGSQWVEWMQKDIDAHQIPMMQYFTPYHFECRAMHRAGESKVKIIKHLQAQTGNGLHLCNKVIARWMERW